MARNKKSKKKRTTARGAVRTLRATDPSVPVRIVGTVRQGRLVIDQNELQAFTRRIGRKTAQFVALNAPFKTRAVVNSA